MKPTQLFRSGRAAIRLLSPRCRKSRRLVLLGLYCALAAPPGPASAAAAPPMCSPVGGAPGPLSSNSSTGFGAIGPDTNQAGGQSLGDFVAELVGAKPSAPPPTCAAPAPGADSSPSEPASLPAPSPGQKAGNPVDLVTGNKYERHTDVVMPDPESGLESALREALGEDAERALGGSWQPFAPLRFVFARHYNSRFASAGPLGPGWRHGFETALARVRGARGIELQIVQADGRRIVFRHSGSRKAGDYASGEDGAGHVEEDLQARLPWSWRWTDGRVLRFDADGRLDAIEARDGDRIELYRDRFGTLQRLVDSSGRTLRLEYSGPRLVGVILPDGARIGYDYDRHGVLSAARYPDGRIVRYGYDDPRAFHLLTGIVLPDGEQSNYRYDDGLRVAESVPAQGSRIEPISLEYRLPQRHGDTGETLVREGSKVSRWRWRVDGEWGSSRLLSVEGEACSSCPILQADGLSSSPPSLVSHSLVYDSFGLPSEARLQGVARTSDGVGNPVRIHLRWKRHAEGALTGKLAWVERLAPDGTAARTIFHHDARRMFVALERPEALVDRLERDPLGRLQVRYRADRRRLEARFDRGWRLSEWRAGDSVTRVRWDNEGRPASIDWSAGDRWTLRWQGRRVEIESDRGWIARSASVEKEAKANYSATANAAPSAGMNTDGTDAGSQAGSGQPQASEQAAGGQEGDERTPARGAAVALVLSDPHPVVIDAAGRRTDRLYDDFGRLIEETSTSTGTRRFRHDAWGRISEVASSGGILERRRHDLAGRVVEREELSPGERIVTRFRWNAALLIEVEHPTQGTRVEYDLLGRVTAIEHHLLGARHRWTIERDPQERIVGQGLPDGSRLRYRFDATGQSVGLLYEPADGGAAISIIDRASYRYGKPSEWRYGNGVHFERQDDRTGRPLAWRWTGLDSLPDWRYRWGAAGLPVSIADRNEERRFAWDAFGRLLVQERHGGADPRTEFFAWNLAGDLRLARRPNGSTWRDRDAQVPRNPGGMPLRHGEFTLHYGAQQRISGVSRAGESVASYAYNAAGERAVKHNGSATTGFLYKNQALAAELDAQGKLTRHYLRWQGHPVAIVDREHDRTTVTWLHGDHLGTPHAATDASGRPVWRADYEAFGRIARERGHFRQPLRFAGQYHDPETGLHDNYLRTYDPETARYLEPDPIGLAGGLNRWAYADGNPVMGTDPLGLILFAFDGTNSGNPPLERSDVSNVVKFYRFYAEGDAVEYMTGVGMSDPRSGIETNFTDAADGNTARARVDYMLGRLEAYMDDSRIGEITHIDIVGYSRGAAMARDFAHRIEELQLRNSWRERGMCITLRFLGMWESVAQFGVPGFRNQGWLLGIPSTIGAVYHAVALNEHRPIMTSERITGPNVIERGFVGDHAGVGGGTEEGDLSDVTLIWMAEMATKAGIKMKPLSESYAVVSLPIFHDRRANSREIDERGPRWDRAVAREVRLRGAEPLEAGQGDVARQEARQRQAVREATRRAPPEKRFMVDRAVRVRDGSGEIVSTSTQRRSGVEGMSWEQSQAFVTLLPNKLLDANGNRSIAGHVNMEAYAEWLEENYGIKVRVQ